MCVDTVGSLGHFRARKAALLDARLNVEAERRREKGKLMTARGGERYDDEAATQMELNPQLSMLHCSDKNQLSI
jgi:hypothetical protein